MSVYEEEPPRLGLQMGKRFAIGALLIALLTAVAVSSALLLEVHEDVSFFTSESTPIPGVKNVLDDVEGGRPQTILLLGSDKRYADGADNPPRSDTIIVVRLDPNKNATAIMSIPRDLRVEIPGFGIDKINGAYHRGGPKLAVRTARNLLGIPIHHVVNVNFGGFARAVNKLGCVYADIDRRYFNDNSGPAENYAVIDLKAGYQKLCGQDALDYVRFRHEDSDFVRAARQQEFLRQAKEQIGLGELFGDRKNLLKIFGAYTDTDIAQDNPAAILRLIKLTYESSKTPISEIRFPAEDTAGGYVEISAQKLTETVDRFIEVRGREPGGNRAATSTPKRVKDRKGLDPGLMLAEREGEDHVLAMDLRLGGLGLPVYFPRARLSGGGYQQTTSPRSYEIFDRNKNRYRAYRIVLYAGETGQYYGVQGTTWKA
ncbi:MAG: LCP family protein, partial [Solirubrobacteraceae bacterium]